MAQIRLYHPHDLKGKRVSCIMSCPTCEGSSNIDNPVYRAFYDLSMTIEDFNDATGANVTDRPAKRIPCPNCKNGYVEAWFLLSDLLRTFETILNIKNSNLETNLRQDLQTIDTAINNNLADLHAELSQQIDNLRSVFMAAQQKSEEDELLESVFGTKENDHA